MRDRGAVTAVAAAVLAVLAGGAAVAVPVIDAARRGPAPAAALAPALPLGPCLRTDVGDVATAQAGLDEGCAVELDYGPARWLAAHDTEAGAAWKAMPDGAEFGYGGHTYRVVDRTWTRYVAAEVPLGPLVHGDLTLQTCDGTGGLVFLHAALVA